MGGTMEDTRLVEGIVIDKEFSHPQVRACLFHTCQCTLASVLCGCKYACVTIGI